MFSRICNRKLQQAIAGRAFVTPMRRGIQRAADGSINTDATMKMVQPPPIGGWARAKAFFTKNRQAIFNTIGMYFVFAFAVHNYRVQVAWDKREEEFVVLEDELERVKSGLNDEQWAKDTGDAVYKHRKQADRAAALIDEVQKVVQWVPLSAEERVKAIKVKEDKEHSPLSTAAALIANTAPANSISSKGQEAKPEIKMV